MFMLRLDVLKYFSSQLLDMPNIRFFNLVVVVISMLLVLVLGGQEPLLVGEAQHA